MLVRRLAVAGVAATVLGGCGGGSGAGGPSVFATDDNPCWKSLQGGAPANQVLDLNAQGPIGRLRFEGERVLAVAIKRARELALLPYAGE